MAKAKREKKNKGTKAPDASSASQEQKDQAPEVQKTVSILSGEIKDDFCTFGYLVTGGVGAGFKHPKVEGAGLVLPEMHSAFAAFNVHLAVVDQVFKHSGINVENIDQFHNHELTALYNVDKFQLSGEEGGYNVVLKGSKSIGIMGRMSCTTPPIAIDSLSGYNFYNELKTAVDNARKEVEEYMNGKYEAVHKEEEEPEENQLTIADQLKDGTDGTEEEIEMQEDESDATAKKV